MIGLGYVGLPLAVYLARHFPVLGFDIDKERVAELSRGVDRTREVTEEEFAHAAQIAYSADVASLKDANFYIVTVPTPVDQAKRPDLSALVAASHVVGTRALARQCRGLRIDGLSRRDRGGLRAGAREGVGARLQPRLLRRLFARAHQSGRQDPSPSLDIVKVTSGSTPEAADLVDAVYAKVITAGTHRASSIRVAEAAKVIENIQRDVNIALINELAMLFKQLGLETREVLEAAGTKWNFQPYRPGLSAATASASIPITSPTRPNRSASIRR